MNQELYKQLKLILSNYPFDNQANFYKLFKFAKQAGLQGLSFHEFSDHVKKMGVLSKVARVDGVVQRALFFDANSDKYVRGLFPLLGTCSNCQGLGLVKIQLS